MEIGMSAALAKRAAPEPEVTPVDAAAGIVADIEQRLVSARERGEQINDAIRAVAYDAARGDTDAVARLAELRGNAERVRAEIGDLTVAVTEARQRLAAAEREQRDAADAAILAHARELAAQFIAESQRIDDALRTIAAAHGERQRLASEIVRSGCLHRSRYSWLDCPTRMACAVAVAKASQILAPGQPPFTGKVFAIHGLAHEDARTLGDLSVANRSSRAPF